MEQQHGSALATLMIGHLAAEHVDGLFCQRLFCHWCLSKREPTCRASGPDANSMSHPFTISDLRQRADFFDIVADRIWQEWWQLKGHPLEAISARLRENMAATPIPFALVAHDGATFLGTSSVIASDL